MKNVVKISYLIFSLLFLIYLIPQNQQSLSIPEDSLLSDEPGDTKDINVVAYFTNLSREEVLAFHQSTLENNILGLKLPNYKLNYPPENAREIIQDQLRSTFLEEIVHPFRESLYVNGFKPKDEKDAIIIKSQNFRQKITLKYIQSSLLSRIFVGFLTISTLPFLHSLWGLEIKKFVGNLKNFSSLN